MHYVIGLGNPGEKYEQTRHNVGRDMVRALAADWKKNKLASALESSCMLGTVPAALFLPETFMNKSGDTVRYVHTKQGVASENFIVVYDDIDVALGELKISTGRGAGGHNGVASIIEALQSKDFIRIRVGVAPKSFWTGKVQRPDASRLGRYVLGRFTSGEQKKLQEVSKTMEEAMALIVSEGVAAAMNRFN